MVQAVLEPAVTLVRSEHMLQVVWKAVESWQQRVCRICSQGESAGAKVKPEWAIQLSSAAQHTRLHRAGLKEHMCTHSAVEIIRKV